MAVLDSFYSGGGGLGSNGCLRAGTVPLGTTQAGRSCLRSARTRVAALWSRGNVTTGSTYSRHQAWPPPLLGSNGPPERSEPALLAIFSDTVTRWILDYGYVAVFLLMLLESACIPIPSEVTMLFGGALASAGFAGPGQELNLILVIVAGTAGNLAGSWLAYAAGALGGRPLLERFGRTILVRPHEVQRADAWFEQHGEAAVFLGRLLPVIRTFISLPAGIARMNPLRFTVYTVLGCLPFVSLIALLGYRAGDNWVKVEHTLQPFSWLIAGVMAALVVVYVARRRRTVRAEYAALDTLRAQEETSGREPQETS